jgi:hypothetical protein
MTTEKRRGKTSCTRWTILPLTITVVLMCGRGAEGDVSQSPTGDANERFTASWESEDGAIVARSAGTLRYQSWADAAFNILIMNETGQSWHGRYCVQPLDQQFTQVIATPDQREFTLDSRVGFSDIVDVRFPEALDEGVYGLSLAVPRSGGPMVDLVPIEVGKAGEIRRPTR